MKLLRLAGSLALSLIGCGFQSSALAEVKLPGIFGDHMVLQQEMPIRVWGWADPGESIQISFSGESASTTADEDGTWKVELPAMTASKQPKTLKVVGQNTIDVTDILIGEVWLCSGQSNMEWSVRASANSADEIAAASHPNIRHIKVSRVPSAQPIRDIDSSWQVCTPQTAGNFTACGYFMAQRLEKELDVPIGLINSSWGGTRVEPWTPPIGFRDVESLTDIYQSIIRKTPGTEPYQQLLEQQIEATEQWVDDAKLALGKGTPITPTPKFPSALAPFKSHQDPTMLYNGMIHGIVGYTIRGAIWYQGESNHAEGMLYRDKKEALINGWRTLWGQGEFPFYYVQIAPYQYGSEDPAILARFWEAQAAVQSIPNTGMVVINDIATLDNIHPPNKQDVGNRLALLALRNDYGRDELVAHSPEIDALEVLDGKLKITFKNTGGGLKTRDGAAPSHFEIIGAKSGGYQRATATVHGDTVILSSDKAKNPVAFRFAWHKLAEPNLTGGTGLPVGACRAGKEPDFVSTLPIETEYELVYDIDLSKLGKTFRYDIDNSANVGEFDRIAYLIELDPETGEDQKLFVSMNAFTDDAAKIGIPSVSTGETFQQTVEGMQVLSTVPSIVQGSSIATGSIEFWPHNYGPANKAGVKYASSTQYDFGDEPSPPIDGYGCMQVHNSDARQTLFAINHWNMASRADIGIGNSTGEHRDWTFSGNAESYETKRLRIYVRAK